MNNKMVAVWYIRLAAAACIALIVVVELLSSAPVIGNILAAALALALAVLSTLYIPAYFARYRCVISGGSITVESGVITRKKLMLRSDEIVFVNIISTPVMKLFGVCYVVLGLAGGSALLRGIPRAEASAIAAELGSDGRRQT